SEPCPAACLEGSKAEVAVGLACDFSVEAVGRERGLVGRKVAQKSTGGNRSPWHLGKVSGLFFRSAGEVMFRVRWALPRWGCGAGTGDRGSGGPGVRHAARNGSGV